MSKLSQQLAFLLGVFAITCLASAAQPKKKLPFPGEVFAIEGQTAFLIQPDTKPAKGAMPWVWYAPTLRGLPGGAEKWMFERFLKAGIAIAGIDVGESYGSPKGRAAYSALHKHLVEKRGLAKQACLLARSRGGLMLYSWAAENPDKVRCITGIYPVCNIASYPGVARAASAFGLTGDQLQKDLVRHNPIDRLKPLAEARVPVFHIHGDNDKVVPLAANSAELARRYRGFGGPVEIEVVKGQGHNMWDGWFRSQKLTDFVIARALGRPLESRKTEAEIPKPIAHWKLDDEGDIARDPVGSHHGKIVGGTLVSGKVGGALEFVREDGNHVAIPYSRDFSLSTFTVSAWVYLTREPTFSGILGTRHGGEHTFDMKVNAAKVHGDIGDGTNWIETAVNFYADDTGTNGEGGDLSVHRWYHIVYVIDGEKQECCLFLDGDLKKRIPFEGKPVLMTPANTMHIGHSSGTEFMDGIIDEVKIWNAALTSQHVRTEMAITKDAKDSE